MSLLSLIAVFLIEQLQPLDYRRIVAEPLGAWADFVESQFNAGAYRHGVLAWCLAVLLPVGVVGGIYVALYALNPIFALLLNVGVLYLTMGFRQFSHHYTEIQLALREEDLSRARQLLETWQGRSAYNLGSSDIARLSIEGALAASHRHVFAVLLWFVLLPGPCGALLYRLAMIVRERWATKGGESGKDFATFSAQSFSIIDWLPVRVTAAAFAIVGDFEDAAYCWRTQAGAWPDRDLGIVLAAGAGALGVQLGQPVVDGVELADRAELGLGEPADVDFMQSAVGLVWRATVLWMLLLFLLGLASLVG
ncbi:CobD/CbiB family protein [Dechloromonas agitata]|uniref:CobD/CbiB family protein n=1 Tax=Dechloromonas agitata TaxID=73030 RepID=UPI00237D89A5|nr:CobD/CbiB family protein [Dechloromonas agitata]MDE1545401.1 CobD/CbiB family protein [Dechloromonas agitata]